VLIFTQCDAFTASVLVKNKGDWVGLLNFSKQNSFN